VAKALYNEIFTRYGMCSSILSDRGQNFVSPSCFCPLEKRLELEEGAFLFSLGVYLFLLIGMFDRITYNHVYVDTYTANNIFV
jgi:hypothetical protein